MGKLKNLAKKLLNPLASVNAVGKVADKIGLGDNLASSKVGKVINYAINPVAQAQGVRDISTPIQEYAKQHPEVVKMVGQGVQIIGAGVALIFPPVGAVVTAAGTGIVYASKLIEVQQVISTIPEVFNGFKTALKNKDYSTALLSLAYLATQGESIASDLSSFKIALQNDGKLSKYQQYISQLGQLSGKSAATITRANEIYEKILAEFQKTNGGEDNVIISEQKTTEKAEDIVNQQKSILDYFKQLINWLFNGTIL